MKTAKRVSLASLAVAFGVLLILQFANAEIYKWVDEKGTVHFTQDPATIPQKYLEKTQTRPTEEDLIPLEQRVRLKEKEEAEIRDRLKREKDQANIRELEDQLRKITDDAENKKRREAEKRIEDASQTPSSGYIPLEKFMHVRKGMTEAEVLSRLGPPTTITQDEVRSSGTISGGTVDGHVSPGGSVSGTVSGGTFSGQTVAVKQFNYIGDRSKGEQTRVITIIGGRVARSQTIY